MIIPYVTRRLTRGRMPMHNVHHARLRHRQLSTPRHTALPTVFLTTEPGDGDPELHGEPCDRPDDPERADKEQARDAKDAEIDEVDHRQHDVAVEAAAPRVHQNALQPRGKRQGAGNQGPEVGDAEDYDLCDHAQDHPNYAQDHHRQVQREWQRACASPLLGDVRIVRHGRNKSTILYHET